MLGIYSSGYIELFQMRGRGVTIVARSSGWSSKVPVALRDTRNHCTYEFRQPSCPEMVEGARVGPGSQ